ncbi:MAG: glutaminyl-peptide cyclotransferase, partial [Chloroflexota bacterium]
MTTRSLNLISFLLLLIFAIGCAPEQTAEVSESVEVQPAPLAQVVEPTAPPLPTETTAAYPAPAEVQPEAGYPEPEAVVDSYPEPIDTENPQAAELVQIEVIESFPHSPAVFTQGLVWDNGIFYESGGLYGQSALYRVDPTTGESDLSVPIAPELFAEGLALVDDKLIMLTWKAGIAIVFDKDSFEEIGRFSYEGQGWGLCYEPSQNQLWMSNGSSTIVSRDPDSFEITNRFPVLDNGQPLGRINELECVDGLIYANVWKTDTILVIDSLTGTVLQKIDGSTLLTADERAQL